MVDIAIIGAGPGGYEAALEARKRNLSVTLIDSRAIGGTCLWVGCIPSKALHHIAADIRATKELGRWGQHANLDPISLGGLWKKRNEIVRTLSSDLTQLLKAAGVELVMGKAQLIDNHHLQVRDQVIEAKNIIIATGSHPSMPPIPGLSGPRIIDSNTLLGIENLPQSIIIIGGGYIGLEWAFILNELGTKVTIVEVLPGLLSIADEDVSKRIATFAKRDGMNLILSAAIVNVASKEDHAEMVLSAPEVSTLSADYILVATGRRPNVDGYGLDAVGIQYNARGGILTDADKRTNIPNVFAIGDCAGNPMLAHKAAFEGRRVAALLAGDADFVPDFATLPSAVFTFPEIASVGLTEAEVKAKGIPYETKRVPFRASGMAVASDATDGFVKIIYSPEGLLLGAHVIGEQASILIAELALIYHLKKPLSEYRGVIHVHPTLSELIQKVIDQ